MPGMAAQGISQYTADLHMGALFFYSQADLAKGQSGFHEMLQLTSDSGEDAAKQQDQEGLADLEDEPLLIL